MRKAQFLQSRAESRRLIDSGRQDHDCALVEDHLEFQSALANDLEHERVIRLERRHDHSANGERFHVMTSKSLGKLWWRRRGQELFFPRSRPIKKRPIFRHDPIENVRWSA